MEASFDKWLRMFFTAPNPASPSLPVPVFFRKNSVGKGVEREGV